MLSAALMAVPMCAKVEGPAQASHAHRTMLEDSKEHQTNLILIVETEGKPLKKVQMLEDNILNKVKM